MKKKNVPRDRLMKLVQLIRRRRGRSTDVLCRHRLDGFFQPLTNRLFTKKNPEIENFSNLHQENLLKIKKNYFSREKTVFFLNFFLFS